MLTGKRAFESDDVGDTLAQECGDGASVLKGTLDWNALPASVPSAKGNVPPSVPGIGRVSVDARDLSQITNPFGPLATNATWRPSGDIDTSAAVPVPPPTGGPPKLDFSGGAIAKFDRVERRNRFTQMPNRDETRSRERRPLLASQRPTRSANPEVRFP